MELGGLESPITNQKFVDLRTGEVLNRLFIKDKPAPKVFPDKARKEDIKLYKDVNGSVPANTQILPDTISSDGSFMSNLLGNGVDDFFNATIASSPMNIPPSVPQITQHIPTPQPMSTPEPVLATKPKESL